MNKATNGEHEAAIQDYTAALLIANIKPEIKAMAHFNRALAYVASKDKSKAVQDLIAVLDMDADLPSVKKMAKQKLVRIDRRASESRS